MQQAHWQREIEALHQFFTGWLGGTLPKTEAAFARLPSVLEPTFTLVGPNAEVSSRAELLKSLYEGHGSRGEWRIWIEDPHLRFEDAKFVLATYEEWQEKGGDLSSRLSTVLFRKVAASPWGVIWLHVHETWLTPTG